MSTLHLAKFTTEQLTKLLETQAVVALLPVGSVEPHGPHLPLDTDTLISEAVAQRAAERLERAGHRTLITPSLPYGVTDYAAGFAGAISIPAATLSAFLSAIVAGYLQDGFEHVCVINNHLEPAQDAAVRAAITDFDSARASVACPLTKRWGRTLSAEFKSGACHAGQYETSLILAAAPDRVDQPSASALPTLDISLSDGIRSGLSSFESMGMERAYTGAPANASGTEGKEQLELLATMVVTEVLEALTKA